MTQNFIGNRPTVEMLERLAADQRLPVALLLTGVPHVGKGTLLYRLGARVLGHKEEPRSDWTTDQYPRAIERHVDVLRLAVTPTVPFRDVLVRLLHHTRQRPLVSAYRLVFLEDLDRLSAAAVSLLLKSVEDAPPFTRFFLAAGARDRVPLTLRSRALVRVLHPVDDLQIAAGLTARGVAPERAREVASLTGGRPGLALALAADDALYQRYRGWADLVQNLSSGAARNEDLPPELATAETAEDFLVFLRSRLRRGMPSLNRIRRTREALLMLRQHVPPYLVVEYALASTA